MNCQIYCIEDINGLKYVGSTTQTLQMRLSGHKYDRKRDNCCSSKKLDLDNCKIYQLESCDISHRFEKEKYWINHINCVNELKLNYDINDKEYQKEYKKEYFKKNKEKLLKKRKEYYEKNKEKQKEYMKEYREYRRSWGGEMRSYNNLLKIDVNLFLL